MLRLSIAMTTYNGEKYLAEQLRSLAAQIRQPDEVVIVDDRSIDRTVEIAETFIRENRLAPAWRVVCNSENVGFKRNFKKALSLTTGDVVFLCDQDDVWCEDKLESMAGLFAARPDVLAVNSSFAVIDGDGNPHPFEKNRGKNNYGLIDFIPGDTFCRVSLRSVFHKNISPGCTMAIRKELAERYVAESECLLPHDHELNLLAAAQNGLYFYDTCLIRYRLHENNTIGFSVKKQSRVTIAEEKAAAARAVKDSGLIRMNEARLSALVGLRFFGTLRLWFMPEYYRYFPFRERVGDLLYLFGRR